jgi:hypothetical protein
MQQEATPTLAALSYATPIPRVVRRGLVVAVAVVHLAATVVVACLWEHTSHEHMLHGNIPYTTPEQAVCVALPVLCFPLPDLVGVCGTYGPDLGQAAIITAFVVSFLGNSVLWGVGVGVVLRHARRGSAAA